MPDLPVGDILAVLGIGLGASLLVAVPGAATLRILRRRSIVAHLTVLLTVTVLAVLAGVVGAAQAMFLSAHDRDVVLLVLAASGVVSLAVGGWLGARLARQAVWADQLRQRERQAEANRRELVAWVSHDLRTPLAGLRAMAEALEDGVVADPITTAEYHRRIRVETDRMTQLVDDLFELSRINAGALRLSLRPVPLADVVSDALASAAPLARLQGIRLRAAEHGWPAVVASEPELARIVGNLLRNAIRFTPYDGVVQVSAGSADGWAWLAVDDTCGGIPEADLPRVFDVAFRGEPARSPAAVGAARGPFGSARAEPVPAGGGLGLAIVRGLVEAHGGRVEVTNAGPGCRFLVHLPAAS
ncbi:HAMP domain-containing sensor histidine kinase [Solwaraspora sp. WMMD791]|uniref:sensor histidine kinase n=1 Tax=Solwaraspora sp. WMMD791 TaxID=3016086 RepID=UPI00249B7A63|nr:HAMP domain-containing sensor histidine kinase [Solwaraspora sp. WMMD791]WFE30364.1 HAMP domain-containing sensor histidine kinase [Solwaraspora sp. WMMD791]